MFDAWKDDPAAGLIAALSESAGIEPRATLADTLEACAAKLDGDVYVILDGVEEYFLYHEGETGPGTFFSELPEAVKRPGLRASFLARDPRGRARASSIASRPASRTSSATTCGFPISTGKPQEAPSSAPSIATTSSSTPRSAWRSTPDLADAVLDEVAAGRVDLGQAGRGSRGGDARSTIASRRRTSSSSCAGCGRPRRTRARARSARRRSRGSAARRRSFAPISARALEPLTGEQKDIAAAVFNHLVTPSGTKIAHAVPDLARYADVSETELEPVLATLARERILRPAAADGGAPRYEIYHDVLGEAVLAWRAAPRRGTGDRAERERAAGRHRRLLAALGAGRALLAVMAGVTVLRPRAARRGADTGAHGAGAPAGQRGRLATGRRSGAQPRAGCRGRATRSEPADRGGAEDVVHLLAGAGDVRCARAPCPRRRTAPTGGLIVVASEDGTARVFDAWTQRPVLSVDHGGAPLLGAAFSADGKRLVTAGQDGTARVWDVGTGKLLSTCGTALPCARRLSIRAGPSWSRAVAAR